MNHKYFIRVAEPEDVSKIYKLRLISIKNNKYDCNSYKNFWEWLFVKNPSKKFHVILGIYNNNIISQVGLAPRTFYINKKKLVGGFVCELMVRPDFRKTFLFFNIERELLKNYSKNGFDFIYGLINKENVLNAHLAFGFNKIGKLPVFVRPINFKSIIGKLIDNKILNFLFRPILTFIELLIKNYNFKKSNNDIFFEKANGFMNDLSNLNLKMKKIFDAYPSREKSIFDWRFNKAPHKEYDIYIVKDKLKTLGYFVLSRTDMQNYDVLAIVDLFIFEKKTSTLQSILNQINSIGCNLNVDFIGCIMNPKISLEQLFKKNLFIRSNKSFTLITHGLKPNKNIFDKWFVTWFDHDVV